MNTTDSSFIKAYDEAQSKSKRSGAVPQDIAAQRSLTIGAKQYRITEFVTVPTQTPPSQDEAVTTEVSMNSTTPEKTARGNNEPCELPSTEANDGLELIELRIDASQSAVPAPHIPITAFTKHQPPAAGPVTSTRPVTPIELSDQPVSPTPYVAPKVENKLARVATRMSSVDDAHPRPVLSSFIPAWEVDSFQWPPVCDQLDAMRSEPLSNFVRTILAEAWKGTKIVAVTQFGRGEGATTLSLCLAKWAAMFTGRVALLDGDIMCPRIADSLGLSFGHGWEEMSPQVPLSETAVTSIADRLVVLPMGPKAGILASAADRRLELSVLQRLSDSFELIILDAGPMFDAAYHWFEPPTVASIGSVLVVQDVRKTSIEQVTDVRRRLMEQQIQKVSIVENFRNS